MNSDCRGCIYFYEERDVNYRICTHPKYDQEEDTCPGRFDIEDANASRRDE